jgi:hypothetical protein
MGWPGRPIGVELNWLRFSSSNVEDTNGVQIGPGATANYIR